MLFRIIAFSAALSCASAAAEPADQWRALTRADVEAAHTLLREDHPAASRGIADDAFRTQLDSAYRLARQRAGQVENYNGYLATMAGFANAMGDRHIWSRPLYRADRIQWAGLIVAKRGADYVVVTDERGGDAAPSLVGARLVSCDGRAVATLAEEKLGGFHGVWSIEAQRVQSAPQLLVDDGNPFVTRPTACSFARDGVDAEVSLAWRSISRTDLAARTGPARNFGAAGYGLRDVGDIAWIALQLLNEEGRAAAQAAATEGERLRAARVVVLDLRGNGGGASQYARPIAVALFGQARFDAIVGASDGEGGGDCDSVWRVSPRNMAQLRAYRTQFASSPDFVAEIDRTLAAAERAEREGRDLSGPVTCGAEQAAGDAAQAPPQVAQGRIVLLTDNACFSSCLIVADEFRRLGALHIGNATNANTHYSEVREELLPSGLSMFSTLQAMIASAPAAYGPFEPSIVYAGDMTDTAAVEAWVAEVTR